MEITKTKELGTFILELQQSFIGRLIRISDHKQNKKLLFNIDKNIKKGRKCASLFKNIQDERKQTEEEFCKDAVSNRV